MPLYARLSLPKVRGLLNTVVLYPRSLWPIQPTICNLFAVGTEEILIEIRAVTRGN